MFFVCVFSNVHLKCSQQLFMQAVLGLPAQMRMPQCQALQIAWYFEGGMSLLKVAERAGI
jgi:hypothetical protein